MDDKPEGAKLGWRVVASAYPFATPWMRLRQDRLAIAGKGEATYTYEERADAVGIVPVTRDGTVLLIRQYRYPLDRWCLEIPAGGTRDHPGATLEEVARIELREEVGATCATLLPVGFFYVACASRNQRFHVFLALDVVQSAERAPEATEQIEQRPMPLRDALELARTGQMPEGQSALSLLLCEPLLRERGYLDARSPSPDPSPERRGEPSEPPPGTGGGRGWGNPARTLTTDLLRAGYSVRTLRTSGKAKRERSQRCRSDRCERSTP
jgi:ADP-ribose pyrophosphatase